MFDKVKLTFDDYALLFDLVTFDVTVTTKGKKKIELLDTGDRSPDIQEARKYIELKRLEKFQNRSIRSLIFMPFGGCNATCNYCYTKKFKTDKTKLTPKQIEQVVKDYSINKATLKSSIIIGGEPLLNLECVEYILTEFPKTEHTICTSFFVENKVIDDLLNIIMFQTNVDISLSVDPVGSTRKYDQRMLDIIKEYKKYIGNRIRIKATITPTSYDIQSLRTLLSHEVGDIKIAFDGAAYNTTLLKNIAPKVLTDVQNQFDQELDLLHTRSLPREYTLLNLRSIQNTLSLRYGQNCDCGFNWFTLDWRGNLTYCDTLPFTELWSNYILPQSLDNSFFRQNRLEIQGRCKTCLFIRFFGGSCSVGDQQLLYCYVRALNFIYSLYVYFSEIKNG